MMEYIKLYWLDASTDDPCIILYEVNTDNDRLAMRSIDIFADGTSTNIDDLYATAINNSHASTHANLVHITLANAP